MLSEKDEKGLNTYFNGYTGDVQIQEVIEINKDSQLNTLALTFQEFLRKSNSGTVVDIGCGKGALLSYLCEKTDFAEKTKNWIYYAVDFLQNIETVSSLAFEKKVNRKVELVELDDFYNNSITEFNLDNPILLVCRNVMHELDIDETSAFIEYLCRNDFDLLILQDLMTFKEGERGNVCWDNNILKKMFNDLGFDIIIVELETKSNAKWLNAKITKRDIRYYDAMEIKKIVMDSRVEQYRLWIEAFPCTDFESVQMIDRDLQITSLASQLKRCSISVPPYKSDSEIILESLRQKIKSFDIKNLTNYFDDQDDFRDRARIQDDLETEMLNANSRIQIVGGPKIGKIYLVNRLLSRRAYGKPVIVINLSKTSNIWSVMEQLFEKMNIHLPAKSFASLREIKYDDIREMILNFLNSNGEKLIIVIRYLEKILAEGGVITDRELNLFIQDITVSSLYSVFLLSRNKYCGIHSNRYSYHQLQNFPEQKHVINLLDDYINRGEYDIDEYPDELLKAIGRHPYMTHVAARIIKKAGKNILGDKQFLKEVKRQLYRELLSRLIDEKNQSAMKVLQFLRMPLPLKEAEEICDSESIKQSINDGLITSKIDYGEDVVYCTCDIELLALTDNQNIDLDIIARIGNVYERAFRRTENPVYLRESIYYKICSGTETYEQLGKLYTPEVKSAVYYWYKKREYGKVIWACDFLYEVGELDEDLQIMKASALVRTKNEDNICKGLTIFLDFVNIKSKYPFKTRYIDSLLFIGDFEAAIKKLVILGIDEQNCSDWSAYEYGCAYLGIQKYDKAITNFTRAIKKKENVSYFIKLSKAYYCIGEFEQEISILKRAHNCTNDPQVYLKYATALLRTAIKENVEESGKILKDLYESLLTRHIDVSVIYCRYLCRTDEIDEAKSVYKRFITNDKWKQQKDSMLLDIVMAEGKWTECESVIDEMLVDDDYKQGLRKRLYLYIARKDNDKYYAEKGLKIKIPDKYKKNVPFRLTHCSLAKFLGRADIVNSEEKEIKRINRKISAIALTDRNMDDILVEDFADNE